MASKPIHPDEEPEVAEEEKTIILERLATYEIDRLTSVDAWESLVKIRRDLKLKPLAPR